MSARYSGMRPLQLAALALVLTAASAQGQSAWAYADVYYDAATDRVIATTTTLVDYSTEYYYSPKVQVSLSGSDGSYAWWYCPYGGAGACTNGNYAFGDVSVSAAPGVTYTVQGYHSVETYYYYFDMDPGCTWGCYNWYDALGYSTGSCSPACQADPNCFCVEVSGVPYNRSYLAPWVLHLVYAAVQTLGETSAQVSAPSLNDYVNSLLSQGQLSGAVTDWSALGGGNYEMTVTGPGIGVGYEYGFMSAGQIIGTLPCPHPSIPCAVVNGTLVLIRVAVAAGVVWDLWQIWQQRVDSPYGWPGWDGSVSPGQEWEWRGNGPPGSSEGNWHKPSTGESLHPDLNHPAPQGPHWDYKNPQGKWWRIWPDGKMTPKAA